MDQLFVTGGLAAEAGRGGLFRLDLGVEGLAILPAKIALVQHAQLWAALYLGLVPTIFGYLAWNFALSRAPASKVSSFMYVQPLVASFIAWLWLGQVPTWLTAAGGLLAIAGVVLTVRSSRKAVALPPLAVAAPQRVLVAMPADIMPVGCRS